MFDDEEKIKENFHLINSLRSYVRILFFFMQKLNRVLHRLSFAQF